MKDFYSFTTEYGMKDELFKAVLSLDKPRVERLKKQGVTLTEDVKRTLENGGGSMVSNKPAAPFWYLYLTDLRDVDKESFVWISRIFFEETGAPLYYSDTLHDTIREYIFNTDVFTCLMECYNHKKMNKKRIMQTLIRKNNVPLLEVCAKHGWLKQSNKRDEMINYANEQNRPECTAWLLDFKNRTADLAAERERSERKMQRELNAAPGSITAMKQIWSYTKLDDGTLRITNYKGRQTEVVIPEMIGKHRVSDIGRAAFSGDKYIAVRADPKQVEFRKGITKITIPEGITVIGANAFSNIEKIKTMELPSTVREIGDFAFYGCEGLEKIVFTGETSLIGDDALCDCDALQEVIFAEGVRKIKLGTDALENCERLKRVVLPSTLRSITLDDGEFFVPDFCTDAWVIVPRGSFAEKYCKKHDIEYKYPEE